MHRQSPKYSLPCQRSKSGPKEWKPSSWRAFPAKQQPEFPCKKALLEVVGKIRKLSPLVDMLDVEKLRESLASVAKGEKFFLQGGDCAESFSDCTAKRIRSQVAVLLQMRTVISHLSGKDTVVMGRMAGQLAKPRSNDKEIVDGVEMYTFKGENINCASPEFEGRVPDPDRLLSGYFYSAATLEFAQSMMEDEFSDLSDLPRSWWDSATDASIAAYNTCLSKRVYEAVKCRPSLRSADLYVGHEALFLPYEEAMTSSAVRSSVDIPLDTASPCTTWYDLSAHFVWIGDRTRQLDHAHVEFFRGIANPIGIKVGPSLAARPQDLVSLVRTVWPDPVSTPGKVVLITRFGAGKISAMLPPLITAMKAARLAGKVVWVCDPMHGNTFKTKIGYKTRAFNSVMAEVASCIKIHQQHGTVMGGVHLELCGGDDVTECLGGPGNLEVNDLTRRFESLCDPRLNRSQSLEIAAQLGYLLGPRTQDVSGGIRISPQITKTAKMLSGRIEGVMKPISRVVYGTLFLDKVAEPNALLDAVWATGCNTFDCARIYGGGRCEEVLGDWLRERRVSRKDVVLVTKGGCNGQDKLWSADVSEARIRCDLKKSLKALGVGWVDVYMLHRDAPDVPVSTIVDTMSILHAEGLFTVWGVSNWKRCRIEAAISYARATKKLYPVCNSCQLSLAVPTCPVWPETTFMAASSTDANWHRESGMAVLAWECLAKGFMAGRWSEVDAHALQVMTEGSRGDADLWRERRIVTAYCSEQNFARRERAVALASATGVSLVQVALKYVASQPFETFVLVGTTKAKHFNENVSAMHSTLLTEGELAWLDSGEKVFDCPKSGFNITHVCKGAIGADIFGDRAVKRKRV